MLNANIINTMPLYRHLHFTFDIKFYFVNDVIISRCTKQINSYLINLYNIDEKSYNVLVCKCFLQK